MTVSPLWQFIGRALLLGAVAGTAPAGATAVDADRSATTQAVPVGSVQTTCPVMAGNPINPQIFSVYKGKRVYFCCHRCKSMFDKEPEPYVSRLPQFGPASGAEHVGHEHAGGGFGPADLVEPMGIVTFVLLATTVGLGLFRRVNPGLLLRWHKRLGPLTLVAAAIHLALVVLSH